MTSAQKYVACATTTALGLFGLLRLPWVEAQLVLPVTGLQGDLAVAAFQIPAAPISVTLACSGTEVIAMCLGAILAYPARWRARISGTVLIVAGILGLNTIRIGTLGLAAADPQWFNVLHLYLWPASLVLATSGAVFVWMRHADGASKPGWSPSWRFAALAFVLLTVSALTAPAYYNSETVLKIGSLIAHGGAVVLAALGAGVSATGNVLWTARGGFSVTGDCVATPLLPVYLAAVLIYAPSWPRRVLGSVIAVPIFFLLGVARLLLVALPQSIAPVPEFASHTFYQVVLAVIVVALAGRWRHGTRAAVLPVVAGLVGGALLIAMAGDWYATAILTHEQRLIDPQGALALWPPFQMALFLALWLAAGRGSAWSRIAGGFLVLAGSHVAAAWGLTLPGVQLFLAEHVSAVRAWTIVVPGLLAWVLFSNWAANVKYSVSVQNDTVSPVNGS